MSPPRAGQVRSRRYAACLGHQKGYCQASSLDAVSRAGGHDGHPAPHPGSTPLLPGPAPPPQASGSAIAGPTIHLPSGPSPGKAPTLIPKSMDGHHCWMAQTSRRFLFKPKPGPLRGGSEHTADHPFHGNLTPQGRIVCAVDYSHSPQSIFSLSSSPPTLCLKDTSGGAFTSPSPHWLAAV